MLIQIMNGIRKLIVYKKYGKLPVDNVVASMSYHPENGYWYDISTEDKKLASLSHEPIKLKDYQPMLLFRKIKIS